MRCTTMLYVPPPAHTQTPTRLSMVFCFRPLLAARLKKIGQVDAAILREQRKNDALDQQIAELKVEIDNEQFNNDFLIHDEDLIRRNQRYYIFNFGYIAILQSLAFDEIEFSGGTTRQFHNFAIFSRDPIHRMAGIIKRAQLVRQVQMQHTQILERAAILELQQLRTFPTLNIAPNHFQI